MTPEEFEKKLPFLRRIAQTLGVRLETTGVLRFELGAGAAELWYDNNDREWYAQLNQPLAGVPAAEHRQVSFDVVDVTFLYVLDHWFGRGKQLERMRLKKK